MMEANLINDLPPLGSGKRLVKRSYLFIDELCAKKRMCALPRKTTIYDLSNIMKQSTETQDGFIVQ